MSIAINVSKSPFASATPEFVAYTMLQSVLAGKLAGNIKSNSWRDQLTFTLSTMPQDATPEAAAIHAESAARLIIGKLRSSVVSEALAKAGYGNFAKIVTTDDGKEGADKRTESQLRVRYGDKFRVSATLAQAEKRVNDYLSHIRTALAAGAELDPHMTQSEMRAAKEAALAAAMSPEEKEKAEAAKNKDTVALSIGKDIASRVKADEGHEGDAILLFYQALTNLSHVSDDLQEQFVESLTSWAAKLAEAAAAQNPAGIVEAGDGDEELPEVREAKAA